MFKMIVRVVKGIKYGNVKKNIYKGDLGKSYKWYSFKF